MIEKEYKVKGGNRLIGVVIGLVFAGVGVLVIVQGNMVGALIALIGAVAIWAGLRPNRLLIMSDAVETHSVGVKRYPYAQMRRVRMVARRFLHGSSHSVSRRSGGVTTRIAVAGRRYRVYPEVQIEGDFQFPLILEVEYAGPLIGEDGQPLEGIVYRFKRGSRYNVQDILKDVLDRLPAGVEVDDAIQSYTATGSPPDVLTLPVENPMISIGKQD